MPHPALPQVHARPAGCPSCKAAVADKTRRDSGFEVDAAQVLITNGGKQAVYEAFAALLDPGDEVIVPTPYWTTYPESIKLAGGVPVDVVADETTGYLVTRGPARGGAYRPYEGAAVRLAVQPDRRRLQPRAGRGDRPLGASSTACGWSRTRSTSTSSTATRSSPRCRCVVPELADRTLVLNGVAKTYAMTGWRVGWMIGPKDVVKAATNLQSHATSNVANVSQAAALAAVSGDLSAVARDARRRSTGAARPWCACSNDIPGVVCPEPEGAFYAYPSVKELLGKEIRGKRPQTSVELAALILEEAEVALVPGEAFGTPGYFRLSYALGDEDLAEGVGRVAKLLAEAR